MVSAYQTPSGGSPPSANNPCLTVRFAGLRGKSTYPTFTWLSSIASLQSIPVHLSNAANQSDGLPIVVSFVVYNIPGRDCSATASSGQIPTGDLEQYKTQFVDVAVSLLSNKSSNIKLVLIIEPDALANLITSGCSESATYPAAIAYAIAQFSTLPNTTIYVDCANGGLLGSPVYEGKIAPVYQDVMNLAKSINPNASIRGFSSNLANYDAFDGKGICPATEKCPLLNGTYNGNPNIDENLYTQSINVAFAAVGLPTRWLVDTSRSGRIGVRKSWSSWCNVKGAGIGERPTSNPASQVDAFVWVKPPGNSDGSSVAGSAGADPHCIPSNSLGVDALSSAPTTGSWFDKEFVMLADNASPPILSSSSTSTATVSSAPAATAAQSGATPASCANESNCNPSMSNGNSTSHSPSLNWYYAITSKQMSNLNNIAAQPITISSNDNDDTSYVADDNRPIVVDDDEDDPFQHVAVKAKADVAMDTDADHPVSSPANGKVDTECSICMDSWTSGGKHGIVSLKCGHLFGRGCIADWITRSGKKARCPTCKRAATTKDIRPLFAKNIVAIDSTERDRLVTARDDAKLEADLARKEIANLEKRHANMVLLNAQLQRQNAQLQQKLNLVNMGIESVEDESTPRPEESREYQYSANTPLTAASQSVRVLAYHPQENLLLVSRGSQANNHGLLKIKMDERNRSEYITLHESVIRDCQISPHIPDVIATASMDKSIRLTSLRTNNEVHRFKCDAPLWSCAFLPASEHLLCAGLSTGSLVIYDIRFHAKPYLNLSNRSELGGQGRGIHSLLGLGNKLLGASTAGVFVVDEFASSPGNVRCSRLETEAGTCTSFSYDAESSSCLATWRSPANVGGGMRHQVSVMSAGEDGQTKLSRDYIIELQGAPTSMTRSCIFSRPHLGKPVVVCARDTGDSGITTMGVWAAPENTSLPPRQTGQDCQLNYREYLLPGTNTGYGSNAPSNTIMDIIRTNHPTKDTIVALTPSKLHFLQWK
ncbi:hypothetical protein SmJEL517_g05860 [Synchytrium microbalum]|uniref:Glucanase n=1 Tax=Synchytrium microbalum TaxID=1806994 RepID=A0A507BLP4_9FUNG|nr:uncharacterized protein SmJEL517_g05860 [Synchytrium microbalum]TPX30617.1 hypothetical protein SmJEL517_g05860 [Synchytrium microbalum]